MYKTASEIADIVLEKIAISPALAQKALYRKLQKQWVGKNTPKWDDTRMARELFDKHPKAWRKAFSDTTMGNKKYKKILDDRMTGAMNLNMIARDEKLQKRIGKKLPRKLRKATEPINWQPDPSGVGRAGK